MDVIKWLDTLLGDCQLVGTAEEAMALVPSLGLDAPLSMDVALAGASPWRGCPVGFARALRQPLGMMVAEAMTEVLGGQAPSDPSDLTLPALAADPATAILARLLVEAWRSGPRSASLVMLEAVRQASTVAGGDFDELNRYSPASAARARRAPQDMPDRLKARVEYLHGLAWAMSVRLGGAWALASALDPSVQQTRLYQAVVANRLVLVIPPGGLNPATDLDVVAGVLGIQVEEGILTAAHKAICAVLKVALEGGGDAAGAGLRAVAGQRTAIGALALDPRIAAMALHVLPDVADAKALKAAGVGKGAQKRLLKREGAAATAALYCQVATAVLTWDVLSALAGRCLPVEREGGAWSSRLGRVGGQLPWPLLTPRGDGGQVDGVVVGVGMGGLWETVRALSQDQGEPLLLAAAQGLWRGLQAEAAEAGGLAASLGSDGIGIFTDKGAAQGWAERVRSAFRPPLRLGLGPFGDGVTVPSGGDVVVTVASGAFCAGWDGVALWASGGAVVRALPGGATLAAKDGDGGIEGLAALAADTGADPFGADSAGQGSGPAPLRAADPSPGPLLDDVVEDPFAASLSPEEPEPPSLDFGADPLDAFDDFGGAPLAGPPQVDFDEDVPDDDDPDAFYLPPPAAEALAADTGADPDPLMLLPPPTAAELAAHEDPAGDTYMLPPPTSEELAAAGAAGGAGYEIEDEDDESDVSAAADRDPFGGFDAVGGDSVEAEDSEADFKPMEGGAGFRFDDGEPSGAPETFRFESPVLDDAADEGGGFSLTERRDGEEEDVWAAAKAPSEDAEAAGGDLYADDSALDDSEAPVTTAALGLGMADLRYLFDGYVHYLDGAASMVFGRRYGDRVLDKHTYEFSGDKDKVYRLFLMDKVEEGFVPRTDLVGDLPKGIDPEGLDLERMGAVASRG